MATVDSKTSQQALDLILAAIGKREADHKGDVTIRGKDPILASRHRFGEAPKCNYQRKERSPSYRRR
jgi:hypothetical protein